jgi:hypothetical protein
MASNENFINNDVMTRQQRHDSDSSNGKAAITISSHAKRKRRYCHNLNSNNNNDAHSSSGANCGGDNKDIKKYWRDNKKHRHHNAMPRDNQQTEGTTRGGASS